MTSIFYLRWLLPFAACFCFISTILNKFKAGETSPVFSQEPYSYLYVETFWDRFLNTYCFLKWFKKSSYLEAARRNVLVCWGSTRLWLKCYPRKLKESITVLYLLMYKPGRLLGNLSFFSAVSSYHNRKVGYAYGINKKSII